MSPDERAEELALFKILLGNGVESIFVLCKPEDIEAEAKKAAKGTHIMDILAPRKIENLGDLLRAQADEALESAAKVAEEDTCNTPEPCDYHRDCAARNAVAVLIRAMKSGG